MTTVASPLPLAPTSSTAAGRVWNVVRLQFTNRWNVLGLPWTILGIIFLGNVAIWLIIAWAAGSDSGTALEGTQFSGSTFFIFIYMMVIAIQAINLTFPFALGYSVTRRDYYLGTGLTWVILSGILTAGFTLLSYIEQWTNGWGLGGHFFTAIYFDQDNFWLRVFTFLATFVFFFFVGTATATIYVRWRATGMLVAGCIAVVILIGLIALVTLTKNWVAVGAWLASAGPTGVVAWSLVITAIAAVAGYSILQRATPKN